MCAFLRTPRTLAQLLRDAAPKTEEGTGRTGAEREGKGGGRGATQGGGETQGGGKTQGGGEAQRGGRQVGHDQQPHEQGQA